MYSIFKSGVITSVGNANMERKKKNLKKARMVISCDSAAAFHVFIQDPVYGKGKLGEIQGLVLGMLDTFNYEQVSCTHFCSVHCCMQGLLLAI